MRAFLAFLTLVASVALGPTDSAGPGTGVQASISAVNIPTYPYHAFVDARHSDPYNMDYPWLNWDAYRLVHPHPQPVPRSYETFSLQNQWLRLTFLPELGGRLYGATLLSTGEEMLYQNPVIKPTHWGPSEQGWWLAAGGIEWCLPVDEHGYEWGVPWSYSISLDPDGARAVLWDTDSSDRVRARIFVFLPADRAAFQITPRLENPTDATISLKYWANAMLAPGLANTVGPDLRFVVPIGQVTVHSSGDFPEGFVMSWPRFADIDLSRLGNWNHWLGFFARPQALRDWAGIYDEGVQRGVARVFPHEIATGVKGFGMGWDHPIDSTQWTDDGSTYVELHSGPSPTFWDSFTLEPGQSLEWTETWLPVHDLPALSLATAEVALGLRAEGDDLRLGLFTTAARDDLELRLQRRSDCALLWSHAGFSMSAGDAYAPVAVDVGLAEDQVVLSVWDDGSLLAATGRVLCEPAPFSVRLPLVLRR